LNTLIIGTSAKIQFENNDFIRYDDAANRWHFDVDGGSSNGSLQAGTFVGALTGNAATATTLQTTRSISLGTAVTSTATNFNGSSNITIPITGVSEAYLNWGGKNLSGSYAPIDAALVPALGANRLAFTAASAVIVEYSQDGGTTWLNYAVADSTKINLLNGNSSSIQVGGGGYAAGTNYTNYLVRLTINTSGQIYTTLNKFIVLVSSNGSSGSYCTIDARTQTNYLAGTNTWTTFSNQTPISGWSGYNVINTSGLTTFGNTPATQYGQVRFTFGQTGYSTTYTGLQILKILGFGGVGWTTPSTLAASGNIYTYDYLKNVSFPATVSAVTFSGALSGNSTTATTLQTARTINGTSFNGSADITTANWGTARTITIGNTAKSVNGSGNVSWTLAEIGAQAAGSYVTANAAITGATKAKITYDAKGLVTAGADLASADIPNNAANTSGNAATATLAANSTLAGGLAIGTGVNNSANQIVRTDGNGYAQFGWINSASGATTSTITRITASNDEYLRYVTPATFRSQIIDPYYAPIVTGGYLPLVGGTMANTNLVTNMNADLLDGQQGSYYVNTGTTQTIGGAKTFSSTISGSINGNAATATVLQTARNIAGVSFNGSANISLNNNAITNGAGYTSNTGTVTGTGTTNYVSKFTSASAIGNSVIYDDGTNVGIGTTSPTSLLSVGNAATFNYPPTTVNIATTDTGAYLLKVTSDQFNVAGNWVGIGLGYSNQYMKMGIIAEAKDSSRRGKLHFAVKTTAGSSNAGISDAKMTIDDTGRVGIGTPSPAAKLEVRTDSGGSASNSYFRVTAAVDGAYGGTSHFEGAYNDYVNVNQPNIVGKIEMSSQVVTATNVGGTMKFFTKAIGGSYLTAPLERMRIDSSGNVGIINNNWNYVGINTSV
jgi:hypothetical protein